MSFQNCTPESLVQRSDSKNPATTCRGITTGGKPCRRSLASPKSSPTAPRHSTSKGVVAVLKDDHGKLDSAAFYCFQHQDQAQSSAAANTRILPVQGRTSIDSLVARLGVASIQEESTPSKKPREDKRRPAKNQPPNAQQYWRTEERPSAEPQNHRRPKPKPGFWASLCCVSTMHEDDDDRPQSNRPETTQVTNNSTPVYPAPTRPRPGKPQVHTPKPKPHPYSTSTPGLPTCKPLLPVPATSLNRRAASAPPPSTTDLLPYIPGHLPPQTASQLLTELSKPISPHDEAGYIYIFWLTETDNAPSHDTAASLLSSSKRAPSDVINAYSASTKTRTTTTRTIKLKIGRANNVHRRMNEWNRQCGYNLSLVRFYPYASSASARPVPGSKNASAVHKVPHAHRVERLVHLELGDKRITRGCAACGREHKEWFEIEATAEGVSAVDEVVRRWVGWAEANP